MLLLWLTTAALILICATISAYIGKLQAVTLWAGRRIYEPDFESQQSRGFQDAITPKLQTIMNAVVIALYIAIVVVGVLISWYVIIAAIPCYFLFHVIFSRLFSNDLEKYVIFLGADVMRREADYRKEGDEMRADAAKEMCERLAILVNEIHGKCLQVPSFREARIAPMRGN